MRKRPLVLAGRLLGLLTVTATMLALGALPASAEPPAHDTSSTAKVITVPFSETVDTTEATTDTEDADLNAVCGARATNGSVWYTFQGADDVYAYIVDASQSDFATGVIVATGTPGNLSILTCGRQWSAFFATAGETYYAMVFSDDPDVTGEQVTISVTESAPPPEMTLTVDDVGKVDRSTGVATVSGTYTCIGEAEYVDVSGRLQQEQPGDVQVVANFRQRIMKCGGTFEWSTQATPESGKFRRGLAATFTVTFGCNRVICGIYQTVEVVRLR